MKCPKCKSKHIVKVGATATRKGKKQRFKCWECGTTFYESSKRRKR